MDRPAEFRVNGEQVNLLNVALAAQPPVAPPVAGQQQQPQDCQILRSMNQKLQDLPQDKYRRPTLASVGSDKVSAGQGPRYRHWDGSILYENAWVSRKGEFRGADSNRQQEIITQVIEQVHMKGVRFLSLHKPDGIRRGLIRMSMDEIREKVRLSLTKGIGTIRDAPAGRTLELDHALDGLFPLPPPPPPAAASGPLLGDGAGNDLDLDSISLWMAGDIQAVNPHQQPFLDELQVMAANITAPTGGFDGNPRYIEEEEEHRADDETNEAGMDLLHGGQAMAHVDALEYQQGPHPWHAHVPDENWNDMHWP